MGRCESLASHTVTVRAVFALGERRDYGDDDSDDDIDDNDNDVDDEFSHGRGETRICPWRI